ncbi:MAG: Type phosphodiesterase/nucleotide pyrophosphatase [Verrucomicrobiales bacterium]|nr:Type phosphodiesterase/nucleotide pyrophosphatase [Verrucomicrobiales bacterium]
MYNNSLRTPHFRSAFVFSLLAVLALDTVAVRAASLPAQAPMVVILTVDGLAAHYFRDPKANMPTLHKLAENGAVADGMKASLPTLTWPNHTTLVTGVSPGKHGVFGNNYWDRNTEKNVDLLADPVFNKDEIVKVPTIYDVAHAAGLKTAGINWPASRGAKTLDWATPDVHTDAVFQQYTTPELLKEFKALDIPYEQLHHFCETSDYHARDHMNTRMLIHVLKAHQPNLALLHLMDVDHVEHGTGQRTPEVYESVTFDDERVKEIWDALEKEFPGRATLIVTSDHGFIDVRQTVQPNVKLRQAGLLNVDKGKISDRRVFAFAQGGSCFIYIVDKTNRVALTKRVAALFKNVEGIDQVLQPRDYKTNGLAIPQQDPRMADLVLTAKDGFSFSNNATDDLVVTAATGKTTGAHGHSPLLPDMSATFIACGRGIKKGVHLGQIDNRDVAPTAAALLGLKMKNVEGRVLKEILK